MKSVHFPGLFEVRVVKFTYIPAITRHISGCINPRTEKIPESLWAGGPAWEVTAYSNDRQRLPLQVICENSLRFPGLLHRCTRSHRLVSVKHAMPPCMKC